MRDLGHHLIWYVDDILLFGRTAKQVTEASTTLLNLLNSCGIQVNWKKSSPNPAQLVTYLGHRLDLGRRKMTTPPLKLSGAYNLAKHIRRAGRSSGAKVARLAGILLDV